MSKNSSLPKKSLKGFPNRVGISTPLTTVVVLMLTTLGFVSFASPLKLGKPLSYDSAGRSPHAAPSAPLSARTTRIERSGRHDHQDCYQRYHFRFFTRFLRPKAVSAKTGFPKRLCSLPRSAPLWASAIHLLMESQPGPALPLPRPVPPDRTCRNVPYVLRPRSDSRIPHVYPDDPSSTFDDISDLPPVCVYFMPLSTMFQSILRSFNSSPFSFTSSRSPTIRSTFFFSAKLHIHKDLQHEVPHGDIFMLSCIFPVSAFDRQEKVVDDPRHPVRSPPDDS